MPGACSPPGDVHGSVFRPGRCALRTFPRRDRVSRLLYIPRGFTRPRMRGTHDQRCQLPDGPERTAGSGPPAGHAETAVRCRGGREGGAPAAGSCAACRAVAGTGGPASWPPPGTFSCAGRPEHGRDSTPPVPASRAGARPGRRGRAGGISCRRMFLPLLAACLAAERALRAVLPGGLPLLHRAGHGPVVSPARAGDPSQERAA